MNPLLYFLLSVNTRIDPSAAASSAETAEAANAAATSGAAASSSFVSNPIFMIVIYCIVIFGALYFFSIRPQKKKDAELKDAINKLNPGDSVLMKNGMYGKIADVTAECFIIELGMNKGVRIPVLKEAIVGVREPNLTNKEPEPEPEPEKKSRFSLRKKNSEESEKK